MRTELSIGLSSFAAAAAIAAVHAQGSSLIPGESGDAVVFTMLSCFVLMALLVALLRALHSVRQQVEETQREEDGALVAVGHPLPEVRGEGLVRLIMILHYRIVVLISALRRFGSPLFLAAMLFLMVSLGTFAHLYAGTN